MIMHMPHELLHDKPHAQPSEKVIRKASSITPTSHTPTDKKSYLAIALVSRRLAIHQTD